MSLTQKIETPSITYAGVEAAVDLVFTSFAAQAPPAARLVLTEHPLETSPRNWRKFITAQANRHGLAGRVVYLVNGTPDALLEASRGVVVINSTVGQKALLLGIPVVALGAAVFNMPGLTFQGSLDEFWTGARPTSIDTVKTYRAELIRRCQFNGGLYSARGIEVAVRNAAARITAAPRVTA
jgi:capsular polysaccharide export protein